MKLFFSSWQGVTLVAGAGVIVVLALILFLLPAPQHVADAPTRDTVHPRVDAVDQALKDNGAARVVFGPLYGVLDDTGNEFGILIVASDRGDGQTQYQLAVAGAEARAEGNATYTFAVGVTPTDLSVSSSGGISVSMVTPEGEDETMRFILENGGVVIDRSHE